MINLLETLITSWIAWIRLFDFDVCHMPGTKYTTTNGLFQRPYSEKEVEKEENIDDWIDLKLNIVHIITSKTQEVGDDIFEPEYSKKY